MQSKSTPGSARTARKIDGPDFGVPLSIRVTVRLSGALDSYATRQDADNEHALRAAIQTLSREVRSGKSGPERLVIAVKDAWRTTPAAGRLEKAIAELAFEHVVNMCIDAYYADFH